MKLELKELLTISEALNRRKSNIEAIPKDLREDEDNIRLQDLTEILSRIDYEILERGGA